MIRSTQKVAVQSGNIRTSVGAGTSRDHLVAMIPPVESWGKLYCTVPIPGMCMNTSKLLSLDWWLCHNECKSCLLMHWWYKQASSWSVADCTIMTMAKRSPGWAQSIVSNWSTYGPTLRHYVSSYLYTFWNFPEHCRNQYRLQVNWFWILNDAVSAAWYRLKYLLTSM